MPIDHQTYEKFRVAQLKARVNGLSLPEVLDDRRLLLTQEREHQIKVDVLEAALKRLEQKTITDLYRVFSLQGEDGMSMGTPAQTFEIVKLWFNAFVNAVKTKTLE